MKITIITLICNCYRDRKGNKEKTNIDTGVKKKYFYGKQDTNLNSVR